MSGPPLFRADAKAFGEELAALLRAPFPLEEPGFTWAEQVGTDGVTYLERLERVSAMVAGESRRVMAETLAVAAANPHPFDYSEHPEWSMYGEIALALGVAPGTADHRIEDARRLHQILPCTLAKLRSGELSVAKTFVMLEETANLDAPECARVEEKAMKNTGGTAREFRARVRRIITKIDPEAVIRKRKQARKDEVDVAIYEGEDGLNAINALIPAEDAALAWTAITERAKQLKLAGDTRSMAELRAAAFVDLLVNCPDGTPRVTWQVQVIVPVGTLLGLTAADGHIPGHGDIPADVARNIAEQAGEVRRSLVDPETGTLLDATTTKYRPRINKRTRALKPSERPTAADARTPESGRRSSPDVVRTPAEWPRPDHVPATSTAPPPAPDVDRPDRGEWPRPDHAPGAETGQRPGPADACRVKHAAETMGAGPCVSKDGTRTTGAVTGVEIPGLGSLPADVVDLIANDPEWQRLLTDPDTSSRLDAHPDTYKPGIALERFIKLRDQHCRFPGCRRSARFCDLDHTVPHGRSGGLTVRRNLACFCRRHHQIKQKPGWKVVQGEHGELTFTTPTGRIYRTRPPTPGGGPT
jgi:hypothetical protein